AYTLLEEGTQLAEKKKFDKALEKYEQARDIFQDLGWSNEVSRINNELLYNLKKERKQAEKLNKFKKKQIEKEKALETLLKQAEEKRKKKVKQEKKEKREKLKTLSGTERKKEKLLRKQKEAEELIEQDHLNESIRVLKKMQKMCKKADLEEEFPNLDQQISQLKATASIPIITDRAEEKDLKEESFQAAYTALDKANSALKNGHIMKAISELNEAKFNLQSMPSHAESVTLIEEKIEDCKHQLRAGKYVRKSREALAAKEEKAEEAEGAEPSSELAYEYMDKSNKEKRKNNYQKAISLAKKAMDIFEALGSEWAREKGMVTKHIVKLEQSYDKRKELFSAARKAKEKEAQTEKAQKEDLKSRVEERRTDRQKKIRKLMKEKKEKEND
ncbi:MAG: hypothetical protein ACOC4M_17590, partial [Promethearchaeia archaeon]